MNVRTFASSLVVLALTASASAIAAEPVALALPTVWQETSTYPANAAGQWEMNAKHSALGVTANVVVNPASGTAADLISRCDGLQDEAAIGGDMVTDVTVDLTQKYCDFQSVDSGQQHYYRVSSPDGVRGRIIVMRTSFDQKADARKVIQEMTALADLFVSVAR